jgi:hypothetical protein
MASTRMGIEIGKGMQEQARARRLTVRSESTSARSIDVTAAPKFVEGRAGDVFDHQDTSDVRDVDRRDVDNPEEGAHILPL